MELAQSVPAYKYHTSARLLAEGRAGSSRLTLATPSNIFSPQEEMASLQFQADLSQKRLTRAGKLTGALADESVRWEVGKGGVGCGGVAHGCAGRRERALGGELLRWGLGMCGSHAGSRERVLRFGLRRCRLWMCGMPADERLRATVDCNLQGFDVELDHALAGGNVH